MKRPRILLADDHRMFLAGLETLLKPDFNIVAAVRDGCALVAAAERLKPDLVVADISMPELDGIGATRQIKAALPATKVVLLTMHADTLLAREARKAGASGYVLKRDPPEILVAAIRLALKDKSHVAPVNNGSRKADAASAPTGAGIPEPGEWLTSRQRELLRLTAEGRTLKEIAFMLNISVKTVEFHKYRLMRLLGARSSAELITTAIRNGIVSG
jgi:DNA-binding NarL/FixJ family response regulator